LVAPAEEHQDLREWMRDEAKGMRGKVAPLPEITAFPVVAYETEMLDATLRSRERSSRWTSARTRAHRIARVPQQPLEAFFPLEDLQRDGHHHGRAACRTP
jgi:Tfp pilus assembly protein PilP